jgi:exonuclease III
MDIDLYRILHPKDGKYTFFSATLGTFSKIDHIVDHKSTMNKYKKTEIISCVLLDQNETKLNINRNRNYTTKLLNDQQ